MRIEREGVSEWRGEGREVRQGREMRMEKDRVDMGGRAGR